MKKTRFTGAHIMSILIQKEGGVLAVEHCCGHGMSSATGVVTLTRGACKSAWWSFIKRRLPRISTLDCF